ncbi:MAG: Tritrans,polycis-undecaprenyl-diphosphate synthase (geranylgeranyl-diphosphate specific) [Parcubacteria group bacterium GW2011_GWB1_42_6]|nr:MAG: Tritrans,polycis-undecaprenyl-diphosphate synthase (geranylgeranyl-diphosphate specific) [Parcubacteria group bacterium GW2011_GWB1_42_6]KKU09434.1 MAG: Tritrans,polycis-undecaprenyl-diphosphate synthase (geranylgeranyl-diphosphate specific) [Parcubacteria group bacterium GW2011_GWF1_45_5]
MTNRVFRNSRQFMINLPNHIAIIPDGNRRWAKKNKISSFLGHKKGSENFNGILKATLDFKVYCLSIWACSRDNIQKRSKKEVDFLFKLLEINFNKLSQSEFIHQNKVRVEAFGRWESLFPTKLKKSVINLANITKDYKKYRLNFLLAYNGTDEMIEAVKKISSLKEDINEETIKNSLWTKNLPPVDLVIRTGGEPHWSNGFMMWLTANSHFYFTSVLWPEFGEKEYIKAVEDYSKRQNKRGA